MIVNFYGREDCPMCIEAKQWLKKQGIPFKFREIFKQPLNEKEILALAENLPEGLFDLYAPKGARKAGLPEDPGNCTIDQILQIQIENPDMIRYPIFDLGRKCLFGFNETTKEALMNLTGPGR